MAKEGLRDRDSERARRTESAKDDVFKLNASFSFVPDDTWQAGGSQPVSIVLLFSGGKHNINEE